MGTVAYLVNTSLGCDRFFIRIFVMGSTRFRQGEIEETATRQAIVVNEAKPINAEENAFDFGALAFSGNTVGGKVALAA